MNDLNTTGEQTVEEKIEMYKNDLKRLDALEKLSKDESFKFLFLEEYFKNEAANAIKVMESEMAYNNERLKQMSESKLLGIGALQRWINNIIAAGNMAPNYINELEKHIEEE